MRLSEFRKKGSYLKTNYRSANEIESPIAGSGISYALPFLGFEILESTTYLPYANLADSAWIVRKERDIYPVLHWATTSAIDQNAIRRFGEQLHFSGYTKGMIISPTPLQRDPLIEANNQKIEALTYDALVDKLTEQKQQVEEAILGVERERDLLTQRGTYTDASMFREALNGLDVCKTITEKKKTLENLTALLAQKLQLKDVQIDCRTPSSQIELIAKNERISPLWLQLGTPIIFECKNWDKPVTADAIRNLAGKATGARTRILVTQKGISGRNELSGAKRVVFEAKAKGILILVLTRNDFENIAAGMHPDTIIERKYHELIKDRPVI